jgi:hypothetical protein
MTEWVVEQQAALICGSVVDPFFDARCGVRVLARHFGVETPNQIRDLPYPIPILLASHGAYAGSSPTVAGR